MIVVLIPRDMISVMDGFKQFLLRGNVVDLAVGVVIGAAFNTLIGALVSDFLTPFIGAIVRVPNLSYMSFTVAGSSFLYGDFFSHLISFLLIAAAVYYFVVLPMNALLARAKKEPPADPTTKRCPECLSEIPLKAHRCAHCTSVLTT